MTSFSRRNNNVRIDMFADDFSAWKPGLSKTTIEEHFNFFLIKFSNGNCVRE